MPENSISIYVSYYVRSIIDSRIKSFFVQCITLRLHACRKYLKKKELVDNLHLDHWFRNFNPIRKIVNARQIFGNISVSKFQ